MKRFLFYLFTCISLLLTIPANSQDKLAQPKWIWTSESPGENEGSFFLKNFDVPADTQRVILLVTADDKFNAYLNGQRGGRLRGENWEKPLVEDITDRVTLGTTNLLGIQAHNGTGAAGVLALLEITTESGEKTRIISDSSWESSDRAVKGWFDPQTKNNPEHWKPASTISPLGDDPWGMINHESLAEMLILRMPKATEVDRIKMPEGFRAELLYSVPKTKQGSWVAMTLDHKNRLIVSDQYGSLYRFPIPAPNETIKPQDVKTIDLDIGGAQGLLYAFDSLYVVLNTGDYGGRGLYRLQDTNGDDEFDQKTLLAKFEEKGGEHGPHAVVAGPDGKSIYVVVGNQTAAHLIKTEKQGEKIIETPISFQKSLVPRVWDEDVLLERPIGRGFMKGVPAPGGWIAKTDPEGKEWELMAVGFRNQYDAAFDKNGQLFTYDADMEWDMNMPWYRPTRINHVTSGAEFGWRNGGGKWPAYYPDSLPAVVDIGPGSPTGVTFGYGAKFPAKYQKAFYAADWSYGKLYAVHLEPSHSGYTATFEEFMSAQPLPLTDLLVNPKDGAMYVAIGGRRVQSGLYRVTYEGAESTSSATIKPPNEAMQLRSKLEELHRLSPGAVNKAWPFLRHSDRFLRYAARIAVEHQPVTEWQEKALTESEPITSIQAIIALARHGAPELQERAVASLDQIDWQTLSPEQKMELVRAYSLLFARWGEGSESLRKTVANRLDLHFPSKSADLNTELLQLLVYLQDERAAEKGIELLNTSPSREGQIALAKSLRHLTAGWTRDLRRDFFQWFTRAAGYKGGASFELFIKHMKETAISNTPEEERAALKEVIEAEPIKEQLFTTFEPRSFQKNWTVEDFDDVIHVGLEGNRDFENGRKMFGAATCFACHRFNQEGGAIGPDLTSAGGKFSPRDLLESIIEPSKEISDQYGQMIFRMNDGSEIVGRVMNLSGDSFRVTTNMMDPNDLTSIDRKRLKEMVPSPVSVMPPGLVNTLTKDDVLDLLAYLISMGDPEDPMFEE